MLLSSWVLELTKRTPRANEARFLQLGLVVGGLFLSLHSTSGCKIQEPKIKVLECIMKGKSDASTSTELTRLRPLHEWFRYHKRKGSKIFETYGSLKWFVNQEQKYLVDSGVLIPETKERLALVTPRFGQEVYQRLYGEN